MDTIKDALVRIADGNPGAVRVLCELGRMDDGCGLVHCMKFDDLKIRGPRVWFCFKYLCGQDIDKLYNILKHNKLVDAIKEKCEQDEYFKKEWLYYEQ